jgi:hypothetical protein
MSWEAAWKDLIKVPEYVVNLWPFAIGFGAMNVAEAYLQTMMPDEIMDNENLAVAAKLLVAGTADTAKFVYWDGYDQQ